MPTDRDREARRRIAERLGTSYGWPAPEPKLTGWRLGLAWALVAAFDFAIIAAIGIVLAFLFGIAKL